MHNAIVNGPALAHVKGQSASRPELAGAGRAGEGDRGVALGGEHGDVGRAAAKELT